MSIRDETRPAHAGTMQGRRVTAAATSRRRLPGSRALAGLALPGLALLVCALTAGCAPSGAGSDAPSGGAAAAGEVTVSCVGGPDQAERPCFSIALRNCRGAGAELRQIQLRTPISVTEGVDQHAAPLYQYSARYQCGGAGSGK